MKCSKLFDANPGTTHWESLTKASSISA